MGVIRGLLKGALLNKVIAMISQRRRRSRA